MSIFDSSLELDILLDDMVEGFIETGRSYEWIQERIETGISFAIQDHQEANQ